MTDEITGSLQHQRPAPGAPLTAKRELYFRLMALGMSTTQACREVGVHRKTGQRWRYGRRARKGDRSYYYPPVRPEPAAESGRFLTEADRVVIADQHRLGNSLRAIAERVGKDVSTISRELRRNADPVTGEYHPYAAHRRAMARRPRPKPAKLATDIELRTTVQDMLDRRWSPEQISNQLPDRFPEQPARHLVPETIYQAIYVQGRGELCREVHRALRTGRAWRKPRRPGSVHPGRLPDMIMISDRPAEVTDRAIPGRPTPTDTPPSVSPGPQPPRRPEPS